MVVWGFVVFFTPLLALAAFEFSEHHARPVMHGLIAGSAATLLVLAILDLAGVGFVFSLGKEISGGVAFFAFCLLACTPILIRRTWLRWAAGILSGLAVCVGLFLTLGSLVFGPDPVITTRAMAGGLVCEVTGWGAAVTDSGYRVELYEDWPGLPLRRRLASISVNETNPASTPQSATCAQAYAAGGKR
jgi:hypothetical protein